MNVVLTDLLLNCVQVYVVCIFSLCCYTDTSFLLVIQVFSHYLKDATLLKLEESYYHPYY